MKKILLILLAILLLISMIVVVFYRGIDQETSVTSADTTAADTSAADTTAADTTEKTPDNKLPDNTGYNKAMGTRFEFAYSMNSYLGTEYNAQGNPLVRRVYDLKTLSESADSIVFAYEYNAEGALTGYSLKLGSFNELSPLTVTYDEKGRAILAEVKQGNDDVSVSWEYDENGLIVFETLAVNQGVTTFMYDDQGRMVRELVDHGDGYKVNSAHRYSQNSVHLVAGTNDTILVDAEFVMNDKGYPVKVTGFLLYEDVEIAYTYNDKMLCTGSVSKTESNESKVELSYNEKDLLTTKTVTNCAENGKLTYKKVFEYDENGKIATESEAYYNENGQLENKYVSHYEYDAKGNLIKEEDLNYDQDGELMSRFVTTWVYDDSGLPIETTSVRYNNRGEELKSDTFFEYDANGNRLKETYNRYNAEGVLYEVVTSEYVYDAEGACASVEHKTYDEQNRLVRHEKNEYYADGRLEATVSYHYGFDGENHLVNNGRTEEIYTYDENGSIVKAQRIDYDANGNMTNYEEIIYNGEMRG